MPNKIVVGSVVVAVAALLWARPLVGGAQGTSGDVEKRLTAVEAGQAAILKELREIKAIIQGRPVPSPGTPAAPGAPPNAAAQPPALPNFNLEVAGSAAKGRANAPLTVIEFSDFECPFCGRYARDAYRQIEREYVTTGKLRYVFRHFPLERIHPKALKASEAAECAHAQGKFWEMHDRLFANQQAMGLAELGSHAQALGLNTGSFQQCLSGAMTARVKQDLAEGIKAGITGTPTFFFGTITAEGKLKVLHKLTGAQPYANFKSAIDALLARTPTQSM